MRSFGLILGMAFLLSACGGESGLLVTNKAKFQSETLARRAVPDCTTTTCTPSNLEGRIYSGNVMLGQLGPGAYAMTWLGANDEILNDPSSGKGGTLSFNLLDKTTFAGKISIPASEAEMPDPSVITRVELNFDYVDATFTLQGTGVDDTYTVRTVFVTDTTAPNTTGTLFRADKLIKNDAETEFKWCNAGGCDTSRDAVATGIFVDATLRDYQHPGQGNENYPPYAITLKDSLTVTYAQISSPTNEWTLDFDLAGAVQFSADPSTFDSVQDIVENFKLKYAPNSSSSQGNPDDGIRATLTIAEAAK